MVKAIVLAGSSELEKKSALLQDEAIDNKSLLSIHGQPMVHYIVSILEASSMIDEIAVVGPEQKLRKALESFNGKIVPETGKVIDNVIKGVEVLSPKENVLLVTSDIPLITKTAIEDFLHQCVGDYDLFYPVISRRVSEEKYPTVERTYVTLYDGSFTGGNVFYVNPDKIYPCYQIVDRLIAQRKNPLSLAMNFGLGFVLRLLLGRLTLNEAEQKISRILKIRAKVLVSSHPELGLDIDKTKDLELTRQVIAEKEARI